MASGDYQSRGASNDFTQKDLYERLEITPNATKDEIIKAYRKQALKYHPDKCLDDNAEEWMKCLNEAKEILLSDQRSDYDETLKGDGYEFVRREPIGHIPEGTPLYYFI